MNAGAQVVIAATSGVLHNDTDVENETLTATLVSSPTHGTLSFNANGDGGFSYTANANFHGDDTFTYKVNDSHTDSNTATVTLHVNALPVAVNDQAATNEDVSPLRLNRSITGRNTIFCMKSFQ